MDSDTFLEGLEGRKTRLVKEGVWPGASGWTRKNAGMAAKLPAFSRLLRQIIAVEFGSANPVAVLREILAAARRSLEEGEVSELKCRLQTAVASLRSRSISEPLVETLQGRRNGVNGKNTGARLPCRRPRVTSSSSSNVIGLAAARNGNHHASLPRQDDLIVLPRLAGSIPNTGCAFGARINFVHARAPLGNERKRLVR